MCYEPDAYFTEVRGSITIVACLSFGNLLQLVALGSRINLQNCACCPRWRDLAKQEAKAVGGTRPQS